MVVTQLRNDSELGNILKTTLETVQLLSGLEAQILNSTRKTDFIERCWVKTVHDNLHAIDRELIILKLWKQNKETKTNL